MPLKLSDLRSDFMLTLGYLNLALNNLTQIFRVHGSIASPKPFDPKNGWYQVSPCTIIPKFKHYGHGNKGINQQLNIVALLVSTFGNV